MPFNSSGNYIELKSMRYDFRTEPRPVLMPEILRNGQRTAKKNSPFIHFSDHSVEAVSSVDSFSDPSPPALFYKENEPKETRESKKYIEILEKCQDGIRNGVFPERISQGSSGSYFVKDRAGNILGVFKPRSEEPYAQFNPKWSKWLHKTCCPCCFGRSCIMTDMGYISEAGASIVDRFLALGIVPRTEIVELGAPTFAYPIWERWKARQLRKAFEAQPKPTTEAPYTMFKGKLGSFQLYVEGCRSGSEVFDELENLKAFPKPLEKAIQIELEKLIVLDYIIRNTDRSLDNILIKIEWVEAESSEEARNGFLGVDSVLKSVIIAGQRLDLKAAPRAVLNPIVRIAAIDNGLAFPYKHPDNWRGYPYGWAMLEPFSRIPFSQSIKNHLLPFLDDPDAWDVLEEELRSLFRINPRFKESHFQRQMGVMRGQIWNLARVLEVGGCPADLMAMDPKLILEQREYLKEKKRGWRREKGMFSEECSTEGHPRWMSKVKATTCFPDW